MANYSISWQSRHQLLYHENGRTLEVEVEDAMDGALWHLVVYATAIHQWTDGQSTSQDERKRIAENLSEALTLTDTRHVLEWDERPRNAPR